MKENNNLFAAVTLFRELYDNDKDIYDVIAEFILSAISYQKKWLFNSTEITGILEETFDFNIPEAVVKTTIRNRLLTKDIIKYDNGYYSVNKDLINKNDIEIQLAKYNSNYSSIVSDLFIFCENNIGKRLSSKDQDEIAENFHLYITENGIAQKYSGLISSFIIEKKHDELFKNKLNAIKEGLILYNGIRYTGDLNELGTWNSNLIIYLDTEHLFNAVGLNGFLYKQIFDDFFNLVREINRKNKAKNSNIKIELKFFPENKDEIDGFFYVAELIIQGKATLDPSKTAMIEIVNGCNSRSDIINKKSKFYTELSRMNISCDTKEYQVNHEYNVEDQGVIDALKKISEENKRFINEEECFYFLKLFTKINVIRRGRSNSGFEKIGAILMSGKSIANFMAHNKIVKFNENDIPFATDIDYITNKFWFKLRKGLSNKSIVPKSFDIVTKAQVVLSTQINESVSTKYSKLTDDFKSGNISKEEAVFYHNELRSKVRKPEEIVPEIIDDSLSFLNGKDYESFIREKSILEQKASKGERAIQELNKIKFNERKGKIHAISIRLRFKLKLINLIMFFSLIAIFAVIIYLVYLISTPQDTNIAITGLVLMILIEGLVSVKIFKKIRYRIKKIEINKHKIKIRIILNQY